MAAPTIYATTLFDKLDEFLLEFREHDQEVNAGVASVGEAAAYAEVWEWGSVRQQKQGPRTIRGTNPDGEEVWMSIQAPTGYIKINENHFWDVLKEELAKVRFESTSSRGITEELAEAGRRAAQRFIPFLKESAPVDTGKLGNSFEVVEDGDPLLEDSDDSRTLIIG